MPTSSHPHPQPLRFQCLVTLPPFNLIHHVVRRCHYVPRYHRSPIHRLEQSTHDPLPLFPSRIPHPVPRTPPFAHPAPRPHPATSAHPHPL
ncbi:hypothetical protein DFH08DRAFT_1073579, partial [Mycena albidolilacea]